MSSNGIIVPDDPDEGSRRGQQDPDAGGSENADSQNTRRRGRAGKIPSREECLFALAHLAGLVALRLIEPSQANAMRGIFEAILREHNFHHGGRGPQLGDDVVRKISQDNPELIAMLEPLLTDAQIDLLMREKGDDAERQT